MSVFRAVLLLSFVSLFLAAGLFFIGSQTGYEASKGGYAVLTVDASVEDRALYELLEKNANIFGGTPVSESTQWVMLDNFGSLETIPLDKYSSRLFSFDPRNDGYAGKLRDVFVRDGKRFVYIPLNKGNWNADLLEKQLQNILDDIPFSVEAYGIGKPLHLFFIVYFAASLCMLVICYANKNTFRGTAKIIPLIPCLASLSFFGAHGIACAAVIFAFFLLFGEPLNELAKMNVLIKNENAQELFYKNIIKPYKLYFSFIPVFAVALGILVVFTPLKLLFLLLVFASSLALFFFSCKITPVLQGSRRRFNPVLIIKRSFPEFSFLICLLPFSAAVLFVVFSMPYIGGAYVSDRKFDTIIYEQDYYAHLIYQTTFSKRQLGTSFTSYSDYFYAEDGLPSLNDSQDIYQDIVMGDFPPFPLKDLMAFFLDVNNGVNNGERVNDTGSTGGIAEKLSLLVLLIFILPLFFVRRKNNTIQKDNLSYLNKLSGKKRFNVVNRNSSYVFSGKNTLQIRKDA